MTAQNYERLRGSHAYGTITLPIVDLDSEAHTALFMANAEQRFRLVRQAVAGYDLPEPPEGSPWGKAPLTLWCWFVLRLSGLDVDPDDNRPLTNWGIDLGFANDDVRRFIWVVA